MFDVVNNSPCANILIHHNSLLQWRCYQHQSLFAAPVSGNNLCEWIHKTLRKWNVCHERDAFTCLLFIFHNLRRRATEGKSLKVLFAFCTSAAFGELFIQRKNSTEHDTVSLIWILSPMLILLNEELWKCVRLTANVFNCTIVHFIASLYWTFLCFYFINFVWMLSDVSTERGTRKTECFMKRKLNSKNERAGNFNKSFTGLLTVSYLIT